MPSYKPTYPAPSIGEPGISSASALGWTCFGVALGALGIVIAAAAPQPLLLPALSILMALAGLSLAALLYLAGFRLGRDGTRGWDIAGALTFVGFAGALLIDSEQALAALEQLRARSE
ncbi:MAG: hypothetical protein ACM31O_13175 [Bacteroidota bacterium]|jgi:hypothetical protein